MWHTGAIRIYNLLTYWKCHRAVVVVVTVCKSCIVKYLEENVTCPKCQLVIHQSHPLNYIRWTDAVRGPSLNALFHWELVYICCSLLRLVYVYLFMLQSLWQAISCLFSSDRCSHLGDENSEKLSTFVCMEEVRQMRTFVISDVGIISCPVRVRLSELFICLWFYVTQNVCCKLSVVFSCECVVSINRCVVVMIALCKISSTKSFLTYSRVSHLLLAYLLSCLPK